MIATALLNSEITIAPYGGPSSEGPATYGDQFTVKCRKVDQLAVTNAPDGADLSSITRVQIRPDSRITAQSLGAIGTDVYEITDLAPIGDLRRPHHVELVLSGPRSGDLPEPGTQPGIDIPLDGGTP